MQWPHMPLNAICAVGHLGNPEIAGALVELKSIRCHFLNLTPVHDAI